MHQFAGDDFQRRIAEYLQSAVRIRRKAFSAFSKFLDTVRPGLFGIRHHNRGQPGADRVGSEERPRVDGLVWRLLPQ